jgi:hypothetical protein
MNIKKIRKIIKRLQKRKKYSNKSIKEIETETRLEDFLDININRTDIGEFLILTPELKEFVSIELAKNECLQNLVELQYIKNPHYDNILFLDLETSGFFNAYVFLFGCISIKGGKFKLYQGFAENYTQELPLLKHLVDEIDNSDLIVTFNGSSFDLPVIKRRCDYFRIAQPQQINHLDLLHLARKKIKKGEIPNRRLITLERYILNKYRTGDIPSRLIPRVFHNFVIDKNPRDLVRVIK